jgi:hypothetical protein
MLFSKQFLRDVVNDDNDQVEVMQNELLHNSRWAQHFVCVFKYQEKYYEIEYSRGISEHQDERPFEYDASYIECDEVQPVIVPTIEYRRVK